MPLTASNLQKTKSAFEQHLAVIQWLLLILIFLFSLTNLFVYLFVPSDGILLQIRRDPVTVLDAPQTSPVQAGDIVRQVAGRTVGWWLDHGWQTWFPIINQRYQSAPNLEITLERAGQIRTVTVPMYPQPGGNIREQVVQHLIVSWAFLAVGGLILWYRRRDQHARLAALIMALLALIEQGNTLPLLGAEMALSTLWFFIPLRLLTRWFTYSMVLHFALVFPRPKFWLQRVPHWPWYLHGLNPLVTGAVMLAATGNLHTRHAIAYPWSQAVYLVFLFLAALTLIHTYFTTTDPLTKSQLNWVVWGAVVAILPNIILSDLPVVLGGTSLLPPILSGLLLLVIPVTTAVAILRYRLWDIGLVVRASLIYGALTLALAVVYTVLVLLAIGLVGISGANRTSPYENAVIFFGSAVVVAFLANPARAYFQRLIDRLFYRHKLDYGQVLAELSRAVSSCLVLQDLLALLNQTVPERLNLQQARVFLDASPPQGSAEGATLQAGNILWLHELDHRPLPLPPPFPEMQQAGFWACAPLLSADRLVGLYALGEKKSGTFLNANDIALIETLARQAGVALQNARLHQELAAQASLTRELEIAQQMQLSLLPARDPERPYLDIAGFSAPAKLVGGDFYHYFEFDADRTGIAVGDVSGKGLPAALLMAVSLSTLRVQAPQVFPHNGRTDHLLKAMNSLLQLQMQVSQVNVALLYAVVERHPDHALTFRVSNGGLISPILLRPGQPGDFLDACGLPMGVIDDPQYYECSFRLTSGDVVILCSDGLIEAMNEHREFFGFERLEETLNRLPAQTPAAEIIRIVRTEVAAFVGEAAQHDDMTMVVVRVIGEPA